MPQPSDPSFDEKNEKQLVLQQNASNGEDKPEVDDAAERALVRKLDMRILPIACLMYLFACECWFSPTLTLLLQVLD